MESTPAVRQISDLKPYTASPDTHYVLKDVYSFFGNNIMNSVAVYVGCSDWKLDLQLLESYAVPTFICDPFDEDPVWRDNLASRRDKLMDWMNYLKESGCGTHFVNPKWIDTGVEYPSNYDGERTLPRDASRRIPLSSWDLLLVKAAALRRSNTGEEPHFALLKIELLNEEINILSSLLASKYRPSILYLRWTKSPDESQEHCEAAGHLQSSGYRLIGINGTGFFIYHYSGQDIYSCCSWLSVGMAHPFITLMKEQVGEILKNTLESPPKQNEPSVS